MMRHTGGLASGLTRTRSSPASSAMTMASLLGESDSLSSSISEPPAGRAPRCGRAGVHIAAPGASTATAAAAAASTAAAGLDEHGDPPRMRAAVRPAATEGEAAAHLGDARGEAREGAARGGVGGARDGRRARGVSRVGARERWGHGRGGRGARHRRHHSRAFSFNLFTEASRGGGFGTSASVATSVLAGGSRSVRGRTRDSVRFLAAAACACRARVSW